MQEKIGKLTAKKGKDKLPLFFGNGERVIPIYGINVMTITQEELLTEYQCTKIHSEFNGYFLPDHYHPYYSLNDQI